MPSSTDLFVAEADEVLLDNNSAATNEQSQPDDELLQLNNIAENATVDDHGNGHVADEEHVKLPTVSHVSSQCIPVILLQPYL